MCDKSEKVHLKNIARNLEEAVTGIKISVETLEHIVHELGVLRAQREAGDIQRRLPFDDEVEGEDRVG